MQWWKENGKIGLNGEKNSEKTCSVFRLRPSVSFCLASAKNFHFGASLVKTVYPIPLSKWQLVIKSFVDLVIFVFCTTTFCEVKKEHFLLIKRRAKRGSHVLWWQKKKTKTGNGQQKTNMLKNQDSWMNGGGRGVRYISSEIILLLLF